MALQMIGIIMELCPCAFVGHAESTSASVGPAQLGMPAQRSRLSRVCALLAHTVDQARHRGPTAALAMRARRHPPQQLLLKPFALLVRSVSLVTRYARSSWF